MKYSELPANLKAQVDRQLGTPAKQRRGKGGGSQSGHATWKCATCDELFTTWASVDRHDPTHTRIELVLVQADAS